MTPIRLSLQHANPSHRDVFVVQWLYTNVCNYSCSYCNPQLHSGTVPGVPLDVALSFVDRLFAQKVGKHVHFGFTGGEVSFLKGLPQLLSRIKEKGGTSSIISNGARPLAWWQEHVHLLDEVYLSFHVEEGSPSAFYELAAFLHDKVNLHLEIMMLPARFDELAAFGEKLAAEIAGISVLLQPLFGINGGPLLDYTTPQRERMARAQLPHEAHVVHPVSNGFIRRWQRGEMREELDDGTTRGFDFPRALAHGGGRWKKWQCHVGVECLAVDYYGNVTRGTCAVGGVIGHIQDPELELPAAPILCPFETCRCGLDVHTTKENVFRLP